MYGTVRGLVFCHFSDSVASEVAECQFESRTFLGWRGLIWINTYSICVPYIPLSSMTNSVHVLLCNSLSSAMSSVQVSEWSGPLQFHSGQCPWWQDGEPPLSTATYRAALWMYGVVWGLVFCHFSDSFVAEVGSDVLPFFRQCCSWSGKVSIWKSKVSRVKEVDLDTEVWKDTCILSVCTIKLEFVQRVAGAYLYPTATQFLHYTINIKTVAK